MVRNATSSVVGLTSIIVILKRFGDKLRAVCRVPAGNASLYRDEHQDIVQRAQTRQLLVVFSAKQANMSYAREAMCSAAQTRACNHQSALK